MDLEYKSKSTTYLATAFQNLYKKREEDDSTDLVVVYEQEAGEWQGGMFVIEKEIPVHSFVLATR